MVNESTVNGWTVGPTGGGVSGVTIKSMTVPSAVENNSAAVVLDCEYSLLDSEKMGPVQLVVRWFLNDLPYPVYQWIPGHRPQDNGPLRGKSVVVFSITKSLESINGKIRENVWKKSLKDHSKILQKSHKSPIKIPQKLYQNLSKKFFKQSLKNTSKIPQKFYKNPFKNFIIIHRKSIKKSSKESFKNPMKIPQNSCQTPRKILLKSIKKIPQISLENPSKIPQKSFKNPSKIL